jgi:AraC-like DNA-binding protein
LPHQEEAFLDALRSIGFDLLLPKENALIKAFRQQVAGLYSGNFDFPYGFRFSAWIEETLQTDYRKLSALFAEKESRTPENYIMEYRIQKVKEWLVYTDATLEDLAFRFGFSSTAHLSKQFRQLTGINASAFRAIHKNNISN